MVEISRSSGLSTLEFYELKYLSYMEFTNPGSDYRQRLSVLQIKSLKSKSFDNFSERDWLEYGYYGREVLK